MTDADAVRLISALVNATVKSTKATNGMTRGSAAVARRAEVRAIQALANALVGHRLPDHVVEEIG